MNRAYYFHHFRNIDSDIIASVPIHKLTETLKLTGFD
jgi:hypothetical protein